MKDTGKQDLCVMIPAYNESGTIAEVVSKSARHVDRVLVVDDGSTDDTAVLAAAAGAEILRLHPNQGKGVALQKGFEKVKEGGSGRVIVLDGDGQHDPDEIPIFIAAAEKTGADIVVGDRMGDTKKMPWDRYLTNRITSAVISRMIGQDVPDSQCGYRLLKTDVVTRLGLLTRNYDTESEMLIRAGKMGFKIASVPIATIYAGEKSKINPLLDTWRFVRLVARHLFARSRPRSRK